ncbi:hypothetical protein KIN20_030383 [Parelaphostrongylus tenuis]|uniref:Uncharacterized protein n=1 Tax=Parelaphostrongylus tenuis TaxID=148309 RepID=A0AAD5R3P2_PARTN|nr:hypothetical protein KIN20_030383 [Parelaphostrongylus tenuis]
MSFRTGIDRPTRLANIFIAERFASDQIQDTCEMVKKMPNEELKMNPVDTLRTITAGKVLL